MCLTCGCGKYDDHMGDERQITIRELADAAIANEDHAGKLIDTLKKSLEQITPDMLEEAIEQVKENRPVEIAGDAPQ